MLSEVPTPAAKLKRLPPHDVCGDLERRLLAPHEWTCPRFGCQTSLATVLHLLVEVSKGQHGSSWPQYVALLDAASEQRMQILPLHPSADLVCAVLQSPTHFGALFMIHFPGIHPANPVYWK